MFTTKIIQSGDETIVLLPDEVSFGAGVDVVLTRNGDVVTMRRATLDDFDEDVSDL